MDIIERLQKLGISQSQTNKITKLEFKTIFFTDDELEDKLPYDNIIKISDLVGSSRPDADSYKSWVEYLGHLHKMRNFNIFLDRNQFEKIILNPESCSDGIPEVLFYNNQYYISGNGKHRLTFAKCLGLSEAKVRITDVN